MIDLTINTQEIRSHITTRHSFSKKKGNGTDGISRKFIQDH